MRNIVILISGSGSNMAAIVRASRREAWDSSLQARVAAVVSNRPDVPGIRLANELGIPTECLDHRDFVSRESFDAALSDLIARFDGPRQDALVVLAGFMRVLAPDFVTRHAGRLVNIHPSLLPAFAGLHTHRRVLAAGCRFTGATVHLVTNVLDCGPILAQAVVPVLDGDTEHTLSARVLSQEHLIYPPAIAGLLRGL